MPGSMIEGKFFIKEFFLDKDLSTVLDVGPGSGNYFDLFNGQGEYASNIIIPNIFWTAVEIFSPYLNSFNLYDKYQKIIISDVYDLDWEKLGSFDLIILGDVLEHMEKSRGQKVIEQAVNHSNWVVISLPIVDFPQGSSYGNIHETHVEQYNNEDMLEILKDYEVLVIFKGDVIGVYIIKGNNGPNNSDS